MRFKEYLSERKKRKFKKKYKVGLCLSGGGARGFAHLGAFKAFEEYGITFDMVAGTSAGSLFGAIYATGISYEDMYKLTDGVKNTDFRSAKLGFLPSRMDRLSALINKTLTIERIEDLPIPLYVVAVDLKTGKELHFNTGEIAPVVCGSCAIPGVFLPVKYKNMVLIDGGSRNNIPADVLKMADCDFVVTIDCNCSRGGGTSSNNIFTQFMTAVGIMMVNNSVQGKNYSDIVICPDMRRFNSLKIIDKDAMIEEGYKATIAKMPEILDLFLGKIKKR